MKRTRFKSAIILLVFVLLPYLADGALKRCFKCRSRGDLGDCKDPFRYTNVSLLKDQFGAEAIPCASGWCGKILEGGSSYKEDDYGTATERLCLQRSNPDNEERCAEVEWKYKKVYMCFCQGDLCNKASLTIHDTTLTIILAISMSVLFALNI